jgi:hypothetical protein
VVAYYVSTTLIRLASLSPFVFLALLLVAYSVAATLAALFVGLVLFTSFVTQIFGFIALAVVDSVTMLPIHLLVECITLAGTIATTSLGRHPGVPGWRSRPLGRTSRPSHPLDDRPDSWLVDAAALAATSATLTITADLGELDVPKSFRQAMRSPQRDYWREAIAKELAATRP